MKKDTNLRVAQQTLNYLKKNNGFDNFFIYYVYNMEPEPKLQIFDNNTFQKNKIPETRWILQPTIIKEKTEPIPLKKLKTEFETIKPLKFLVANSLKEC